MNAPSVFSAVVFANVIMDIAILVWRDKLFTARNRIESALHKRIAPKQTLTQKLLPAIPITITLSQIPLLLVFFSKIDATPAVSHEWARALEFLAIVSLDFLDGFSARVLNAVSSLGESLDHLTDKFCQALALYFLLWGASVSANILVIILILSDLPTVLIKWLIAQEKGKKLMRMGESVAPASPWGKLKRFFQIKSVALLLLGEDFFAVGCAYLALTLVFLTTLSIRAQWHNLQSLKTQR